MSTPNLEQQRKRAKDLLKAARRGDVEAAARVRRHLSRAARPNAAVLPLVLAEAQLVIAREAGHDSWSRMKHSVAPPTVELPPVHAACGAGDEATVRRLLDAGANTSDPDGRDGWTPLIHLTSSLRGETAARCRIARLLVERGADPNEHCMDIASHDGTRTAYASSIGRARNVELAQTLLDLGGNRADPNVVWAAAEDSDLDILRFVLGTHPPEWTLHHALGTRLALGDPIGVRLLLEAGANANIGGGWGRAGTHLHHAVLQRLDSELIEMLIEYGANLSARDRDGGTALAVAYRTANDDAAAVLLRHGAKEAEIRDEDRILREAMQGDVERVQQLVATIATKTPHWMRTDHQMLSWALRNQRDDGLAAFLAAGLDPTIADDAGDFPLHIAAEIGLVDAVAALVRHGGLHASRDRTGRTPLDRALALGEPPRRDIVRLLLDAGSDAAALTAFPCGDAEIDHTLRGRGAVEHEDLDGLFERAADAIAQGDIATLRTLLEDTPTLVHARSRRHHRGTLLHYIGANDIEHFRQKTAPNAVAICKLLLDAGSEIDALAGSYGGGPAQTTLALMASSDHPARAGLTGELVSLLARHGARVDGLDDDGLPLATAVSFRMGQAVTALADAGARLDNLIFAAAAGRLDIVEQMIDDSGRATSASIQCRVPWLHMSRDGVVIAEQALVHAAAFGHVDVVRFLAERGVNVDATPTAGIGALHEASLQGRGETVALLLELGASPARRDDRWESTAYGWAFEGKHIEICRLLARSHPPDILDACMLGWIDRVRELVDDDPAAVNAPDGTGAALRTAAYHGHQDLVVLMLARGADPLRTNDAGLTALDYARERKHAEVVRTLLDAADFPDGG